MTLPSAPSSIAMCQVNTEKGSPSTAQVALNDSSVRALFGVPSGQISMSDGYGKSYSAPPGQILFTTTGASNWTVPAGVTSISALLIGSGPPGIVGNAWYTPAYYCYCNNRNIPGSVERSQGSHSGGGNLRWVNNLPVQPGQVFQTTVGYYNIATKLATQGGNGAYTTAWSGTWNDPAYYCAGNGSFFACRANNPQNQNGNQSSIWSNGTGNNGNYGGGAGGCQGGVGASQGRGGGGAAGYTGNGGNGQSAGAAGQPGSGGGGGGGGAYNQYGLPGGGVGVYGAGSSGSGGTNYSYQAQGYSPAGYFYCYCYNRREYQCAYFYNYTASGVNQAGAGSGGSGAQFGGGGGSGNFAGYGAQGGATGAVRIIWKGNGPARAYPSQATGNV